MSFPFRNQPWTALYILYSVVSILVLRLPFWIIVSALPSSRPRRSWSMGRTVAVYALQAVVAAMYEIGFGPPKDPATYESQLGFVWVDGIAPDMVVGDVASAAKVNNVSPTRICGYWSGKTGADGRHGQAAAAGERVLYMLHGTSLATSFRVEELISRNRWRACCEHWSTFFSSISDIMQSGSANPKLDSTPVTAPILDKTGGLVSRAFAAEYRLCSAPPFHAANPFPANLLDAVAGYQYLVKDVGFEPKNIVVAGISSGGHLALDLVLYLAQSKFPSLALPAGLLLMSPTLDWARTHDTSPACSMRRNRAADIVEPILSNGYTARALLGALPKSELATNAYLSPASLALPDPRGLFAGFPRTCITAGGAEQTLDPMRTVRDRLVSDNGEAHVRYLEYADANHSFLTLPLFGPQRSRAYSDIGRWIKDVFEGGK